MDKNHNGSNAIWTETEAGRRVQARLSDERTLAAIEHLLARIDTLEKAVEDLNVLMKRGPGLAAMTADMIDETYREADARGVSIDERLKNALTIAEKLTAPKMVENLETLTKFGEQLPGIIAMVADMADEKMKKAIEHGFDPQALSETAGAANTALTNAKAEPPAKVGGIFGILRALRDKDRQRGLGFMMNFLKHFGRHI